VEAPVKMRVDVILESGMAVVVEGRVVEEEAVVFGAVIVVLGTVVADELIDVEEELFFVDAVVIGVS
jgi:hypothetical protein